jgi:hypothetical protein
LLTVPNIYPPPGESAMIFPLLLRPVDRKFSLTESGVIP